MNKARFKKLKKGTQVHFNKKAKRWYDENAFEICKASGSVHEDHENSFFWHKAIGQGMPYKATYLSPSPWADHKDSECKIKVTVGNITDTTYVDIRELK